MTPQRETKGFGILASRIWIPTVLVGAIFIAKSAFEISEKNRTYLDAALAFFGIYLVIRLFDTSIQLWYQNRQRPYPLPNVLRGLILGVIYILVLFVILKNMLQVNITPYLATSAILTMVLGLAFQPVLSNIFSGMSLHFTKSFSRGDWVGIGNLEGVVVDTNWRETRLLDRHSNIVVLPNTTVASEKITNFSLPDTKAAVTLPLKISYEAPATEVINVLVAAASDCPEVSETPLPLGYVQSFDEFGVSYLIKFWITDYARKDPIITAVGRLAWYKLHRKHIGIALSIGDRIKNAAWGLGEAVGGPRHALAAALPAGELLESAAHERVFRDLLQSSFLRDEQGEGSGSLLVPEEELRALASSLRRAAYTKDEVLFRQGEKGESCFVVASGRIRGRIAYEENGKKFSSEFQVNPGGLFGEMSLFTGMPRTATGIVDEESELIEIEAAAFAALIQRNPAIAEEIAEIVSARNEQNKEFLSKIKELSEKDIQDGTNKKSILEYLKRFVHSLKK